MRRGFNAAQRSQHASMQPWGGTDSAIAKAGGAINCGLRVVGGSRLNVIRDLGQNLCINIGRNRAISQARLRRPGKGQLSVSDVRSGPNSLMPPASRASKGLLLLNHKQAAAL